MIEIFVDGSVRCGNPGLAAIAIYVRGNGICKYKNAWLLPQLVTNNVAEYEAVLAALVYLKEANKYLRLDGDNCVIITDSQLVYGHVIKNWKCNFAHLRVLRDEVKNRLKSLPFRVEFKLVSRIDNEVANELAQAVTEKEKLVRRG